ncbi:hypothetical protein MUG91_G80n37 [Manis pentadactyla]|nr:hypothetical protein MUG91_G80n37 [Manis pentadactyla]
MSRCSQGCMKKMSSVNLDKLINDFSHIEKKMIETSGKNSVLDMHLEKTNNLLKVMQTKEIAIKEGENEQLKRDADVMKEKLKSYEQFDTKLARIQNKSKSYPDSTVSPQSIYRRKLQHLQEEKDKEITVLRNTIRDLEQRISVGKDPHRKRRRF